MTPLEKFIKQQAPTWPAITVRRNGSMSVNSYAVDAFSLGNKRFAVLFLDKEEGTIAIRFLDDESDPSAVRISKEKNRTFVISCQAFLKYCELPYKQGSRIYRAGWDEKREMLLIKML